MITEHNLEGFICGKSTPGGTASVQILVLSDYFISDLALVVTFCCTHPASPDDAVLEGKSPFISLDFPKFSIEFMLNSQSPFVDDSNHKYSRML